MRFRAGGVPVGAMQVVQEGGRYDEQAWPYGAVDLLDGSAALAPRQSTAEFPQQRVGEPPNR